jgi:hypothetical protein
MESTVCVGCKRAAIPMFTLASLGVSYLVSFKLPALLYGIETWRITLMENIKLRVFVSKDIMAIL